MTARSLELRDVLKAFPGFALGPLSLAFAPGRVHGLLGPNGAGKTTLLSLITLQTQLSSGELLYGGEPITWGDLGWKQRIAYVREMPSFYDELTVEETLRLAGRLFGRWDASLASNMARRFGLQQAQRIRVLSKGTRVKLGIVAALAQRAELLVLDEPTAGVDPTGRDELHDILKDLRHDRPELCVLLSSHIFEDLESSADEVLILRDGALAFQAARDELVRMSLYRVPAAVNLPTSDDIYLRWMADGEDWIVAGRDSATALRLRATQGCVEETAGSILAAVYRGTGRIKPQVAR